jgi:lipopolysaccharide export system protein LptC
MSSPTRPVAERARRANRIANVARFLSAGALAAVALFFVLFLQQAGLFEALGPRPPSPPPELVDPEEVRATGTKASGFDREKQPYDIAATAARQDKSNPNLVHLDAVTGRFSRRGGEQLTLSARTAIYDTKAKAIDLEGDIQLQSTGNWTASLQKARIVLEEKRLTSQSPVAVQTSNGLISAQGVEVSNDGKRVLFSGGVKATFGGASNKGDATP